MNVRDSVEQRFEAELVARGPKGAWTFLPIPFRVEEIFGPKGRVPVAGTINGFKFRNSLLPNGDGTHSMPVNKELLAGAKTRPGETVSVVLTFDSAPRTVAVPEDLTAALGAHRVQKEKFSALPHSHQKEFVNWIIQAKKAETRSRRVQKAIEMLSRGTRPKG